jgi:protein involved in polysaccharide export with SLBB domain
VPAIPATVSVFGAVFTEGSYLYRSGRSASDYLSLAGGPTKRADSSQIFVIRADGSAAGQRDAIFHFTSARSVRAMPGDTIVVPEDFERQTWTKSLKDWTQILYQFGLGAGGCPGIC